MEAKYTEVDYNEIYPFIVNSDVILLVTATMTETEELHRHIKPLPNFEGIAQVIHKNLTYFFGIFGNYKIAHVQTEMGSSSRSGSILTVSEAIATIKSKVVLMIGIAFGVNSKEQQIGDVLIAETILHYDPRREGKTALVERGSRAQSSKKLISRAKNIHTWKYILPSGKLARTIPAAILSGEVLIDNVTFRDELLNRYPTAKGGEMEGAGLFAACDGQADWLLVKGICDFADGNKSKGKEKKQKIAIQTAVSFCLEMFTSKTRFKVFGILPLETDSASVLYGSQSALFTLDVLFEIYETKYEQYYLIRELDQIIASSFSQYGVWVHGASGSGKSSLVLRNLLINDKEFVQIDLGGCIGRPVDDFFRVIYFELAERIGIFDINIKLDSFIESSKAIIDILKKYYSNREVYLYIDEIPIGKSLEYQEFTNKVCNLINSIQTRGIVNIRFVLASIENPVVHLKEFQRKVIQYVKFVEVYLWQKALLEDLIKLIAKYTGAIITTDLSQDIQIASKGSPRFIKKYFRDVITLEYSKTNDLKELLEVTKREYFC